MCGVQRRRIDGDTPSQGVKLGSLRRSLPIAFTFVMMSLPSHGGLALASTSCSPGLRQRALARPAQASNSPRSRPKRATARNEALRGVATRGLILPGRRIRVGIEPEEAHSSIEGRRGTLRCCRFHSRYLLESLLASPAASPTRRRR